MPKRRNKSNSFRTKSGMCTIENGSILLVRKGIRGALSAVLANIWEALGIQGNFDEIPISAIKQIKGTAAVPAATRAHFSVQFNQNGKIKKRLIIMPGILGGGENEYELALSTFSDAGIVVDTA